MADPDPETTPRQKSEPSGTADEPAAPGAGDAQAATDGGGGGEHASAKESASTPKSVLSSVRDVAFIAAIFLYFAGYEYHYLAFSNFNIPPDDVAIQSYFVFAYPVLGTYIIEFALFALTGLGMVALLVWAKRKKLLAPDWLAFVQAIAAFAFSAVIVTFLYKWANDTAAFDSIGAASSTPCRFVLKGSSAKKYDIAFRKLNDQFKLGCLYETKEMIYVVRLLQDRKVVGGRQYVYSVPKADIELSVSYVTFDRPQDPLRLRLWRLSVTPPASPSLPPATRPSNQPAVSKASSGSHR